eukprot:4564504-Pyramimonas_sp.AAC.1
MYPVPAGHSMLGASRGSLMAATTAPAFRKASVAERILDTLPAPPALVLKPPPTFSAATVSGTSNRCPSPAGGALAG